MTSSQNAAADKTYLKEQGLGEFIDLDAASRQGIFDTVSGKLATAFAPEIGDLARLHRLIRSRRSFTVLEFGLGYSTIVMADALEKNQRDWESLTPRPAVRNRFLFQLFAVDASAKWIARTKKEFPERLRGRVHLRSSAVEIGTFNGQLCHYYKAIPDVVPDFIYLDGPSPKDVKGRVNGLSFGCDERTVMSGDLLLMEPTFLPGTFILVDGRTNNVRFLQRNFKRRYAVRWDRKADVTTFELREERLGKHNLLGTDFF